MRDKQERFFLNQALPGNAANESVNKVLDFGRNIVPGTDLGGRTKEYTNIWPEGIGITDVFTSVFTGEDDFAGVTHMNFKLDVSKDNVTWTELWDRQYARANLTAGTLVINEQFPHDDRMDGVRYVRFTATSSGTWTAGEFSAGLNWGGAGVPGVLDSIVEREGYNSTLPNWRTQANPIPIP